MVRECSSLAAISLCANAAALTSAAAGVPSHDWLQLVHTLAHLCAVDEDRYSFGMAVSPAC